MRRLVGASIAAIVLASLASAGGALIDLSASSEVFLTDPSHADHLSATLKGHSCEDAVFTFTIRHEAVELFRREVPMAQIFQCDWVVHQPENAQWAVLHVLNGAVSLVRASDRGCFQLRPIGCWVSPSFDRLQKANAALMCFSTGSEASSCVAYDPEIKAITEVRRYSE